MIRLVVLRSLSAPAALLALTIGAAPLAAFAQRPGDTPAIEALQERILAVQQRDGENSADLIDPLTQLGFLYDEGGDHVLAAAAIMQAVHIVRLTYGLHTLEQAPLIRRLIAANKAIGDYESAWEIEQDLLTLAERYPNDLRTARILSDSADSRMDLLQRFDAGAAAPEIVLGCYYNPSNPLADISVPIDKRQQQNCLAGSRSLVRKRLLRESQVLNSTAINIILQNESYASEDLPPLLWDLVRNSYRYEDTELGQRGKRVGTPSAGVLDKMLRRSYRNGDYTELGRRSLTYLLAYQVTNSEPWLARIETLVAIADWDLVHAAGRKEIDQALDEYRQAYALLKEHQVPQEAIDRIFSPEVPIVLPAFELNPLDAKETPRSAGHIEVGFEVTREGRSKRVRVLDATENSLRTDERRLTQAIAGRIFRPRVKDGVFPDSVPVVVRYYYEEGQPWFAAVGAEDIGP